MGFKIDSEVPTESSYLLVENYNHDRSCLASAGQGIFGILLSKETPFFIANGVIYGLS